MKRVNVFVACALLALAAGCSLDDAKPLMLYTSMGDMTSDAKGRLSSFVTDEGKRYTIANELTGYEPRAIYRVVTSYDVLDDGKAQLYTLDPVWLLRDSTDCRRQDPVGVVAVWRSGKYVNLQLTAKTANGRQYWGYANDSVTYDEQTGKHHHYLSLHHNVARDLDYYTATLYASIPLDSLKTAAAGDSISITIATDKDKTKQYTVLY